MWWPWVSADPALPFPRLDHFLGGVVSGLVLMVAVQAVFFTYCCLRGSAGRVVHPLRRKVELPPELRRLLPNVKTPLDGTKPDNSELLGNLPKEDCLWANLALLHTFLAVRDTRKMRERFEGYLARKVSELSRRMGSYIVVRSYDLGNSSPFITDAAVIESVIERDLNRTTIKCRLTYTGCISIQLDVALPLGIPATVHVTLEKLSGMGRLQISSGIAHAVDPVERDGHWSFAFHGEPEMVMKGKNVARLTSLIQSILRSSFRKRHVLPAYRARYILKDRLIVQSSADEASDTVQPLSDIPSFKAQLGFLNIRVDCLNNILHSVRKENGIFSHKVYVQLVYGDGLVRRRTQAVRVYNCTATWDEILTLEVTRDCNELEIQLFEKFKLSKDVMVARCTIKLQDIVSTCVQSGPTEWHAHSEHMSFDTNAIGAADIAEESAFASSSKEILSDPEDANPVESRHKDRLLRRVQTHVNLESAKWWRISKQNTSTATAASSTSLPVSPSGSPRSSFARDINCQITRKISSSSSRTTLVMPTLWLSFSFEGEKNAPLTRPSIVSSLSQRTRGDVAAGGLLVHCLEPADSNNMQGICCECETPITPQKPANKCTECGVVMHKQEKCSGPVRLLVCPGDLGAMAPTSATQIVGVPSLGNTDELPEVQSLGSLLGDETPLLVVSETQLGADSSAKDGDPTPSLLQTAIDHLQFAVRARSRLCAHYAAVAARQKQQIQEQLKLQQQFVRRQVKSDDGVFVTETQYWFDRVQAIQVILENGEREKERLNQSIALFDNIIVKLTGELKLLGGLLSQ